MKFSKIANMCKRQRTVYITNHNKETWIGTPAAMFKCPGDISVDKCGLLTLLNVPPDKFEEYQVIQNNLSAFNLIEAAVNSEDSEKVIEIPVQISFYGTDVMICATETGAILFNKEIVNIIKEDVPQFYLTKHGKTTLLTAITDNGISAAVYPMKIPSEKQMKNLDRLIAQLKLAKVNKMYVPKEDEQVEIDDYPFD